MHLIAMVFAVTCAIVSNFSVVKCSNIVFRDNYESVKPQTPIAKKPRYEDHNGFNQIGPANLEKRLPMKETKPGVFAFQFEGIICSYKPYLHKSTLVCNRTPCQRNSLNVWICGRQDDSAFSCILETSRQLAMCMEMPGVRTIITPTTTRPVPLAVCPEGQFEAQDGSCRPPFEE